MNASLPHPMVTPRAHRAPPLPSAHVALGQGSRWRWLFPSTHPRPLSSRGLPSASSPPHPGRGFGQGLLRLGGVLPLPPPSLASLISSRGVSWLWPPPGLLLTPLPCCTSAATSASLPPETALISICQQLAEGQTDTRSLPPYPFWPGTDSPASHTSPPIWDSWPGFGVLSCPPLPWLRARCVCVGCGSAVLVAWWVRGVCGRSDRGIVRASLQEMDRESVQVYLCVSGGSWATQAPRVRNVS